MSQGTPATNAHSGSSSSPGPQMAGGSPGGATILDKRDYQCIFPQYIDARLTARQGRRIPKALAVDIPTVDEMILALRRLGYTSIVRDTRSSYPRSQGDAAFTVVPRECVRVAMKQPANTYYIRKSEFDTATREPVISSIPTKGELLRQMAEIIRTTQAKRPVAPTVEETLAAQTAAMTPGGGKSNKKNKAIQQ